MSFVIAMTILTLSFIIVSLVFVLKRCDSETAIKILISGIIVVIVTLSLYVNYRSFKSEDERYEIVETSLIRESYSITAKDSNGDIEIMTAAKVIPTDEESYVARCKYGAGPFFDTVTVYFMNENEVKSGGSK